MSAKSHTINLEPDCANCAAYCCVALAFDQSDMFGFDKQAAEPCRNLSQNHECTIHNKLNESGFAGCVRYNCFGAGQRVYTELFNCRSWRDYPQQALLMFDSYRQMHKLHEYLAMLHAAQKLELRADQRQQVDVFIEMLTPDQSWSPPALQRLSQSTIFDEISRFFRGLKR